VSTQEIIAELPKLNRRELEQVNSKLHELLATPPAPRAAGPRLKQFAGTVRGLPSDMARNHDYYLHGRPKK
jgi:mRNA-degrading endonuclease RelE of RelBE toxin-antitoxin system